MANLDIVKNTVKALVELVEQLVGWLAKMAIDGFLEGLKTAASILNGIKEVFDYISGKHPTIDINKGVPGAPVTSGNNFIGVPVPPENRHAKGGIITKPENGLIGESGPEAIIPLSGTGMDNLTGGLVFDHEAFTVLHASSKVLNVNFEKVNDTVSTGFTGFLPSCWPQPRPWAAMLAALSAVRSVGLVAALINSAFRPRKQ